MYEQIKLPYSYGDLEPYIDAQTVEIHYTKHHATYCANFNKLIAQIPEWNGKPLEEILANVDQLPAQFQTGIRNQGGGLYNHNIYFEQLSPQPQAQPDGALAAKIEETFGDFDELVQLLGEAAIAQFGSGYSWLVREPDGALSVSGGANQDTPLAGGRRPLLNVDVWEHAYYLKYKNVRPDYVSALFHIIDWKVVERRYQG